MKHVVNFYLKIKPVEYKGFVVADQQKYEMVGTVIARDERIGIPVGARVLFDSFMAKKYPVVGKENEYEYFISVDEVVEWESDDK